MKQLSDFCKGLDTLNLILFWGIIIVVILIIVIAVIMIINKKKKTKEEPEITNEEEQVPIINQEEVQEPIEELLLTPEEPVTPPQPEPVVQEEPKIEEEKNFVAEEHVLEYDNNLFNIPSLKKNNQEEPEKKEEVEMPEVKQEEPFTIPTKPYERNVLRQMSLSQTSPIGLTIPKEEPIDKNLPQSIEDELSKETQYIIKEEDDEIPIEGEPVEEIREEPDKEFISPEIEPQEKLDIELPTLDLEQEEEPEENLMEDTVNKISSKVEDENAIEDNQKYLEEVSKKLAEAEVPNEIKRTEYEKKEEEDAIISLKELMDKKDTLETVNEDNAVISIDELEKRKTEEEKLYNLTDEEETDEFINELKKFRNDLE